ncbi:MAG TPA: DUF3276 family protein [Flavobacteriales bacterium]|jgi:hypothetical protein|nr:DUF3276 family protein [Flavobacteriales bacterium]HHZ96415.1 DUF3276 family protein [Flavobacteriales bacterium]HIB77110.1 DUF3276 family protein [Flavobacteriales bacterium]HIO16719.1 DUF3276 family protein [Flavobacteriales bacterium]HIO59959.1 DUF3276 family protein [Flavobacteriales bacterium]
MSDYGNDNRDREELYSVRVRAGKRTYFFDVKETRGKDLYMTITESKRNFDNSGNVHYSKHKLFLYREDFEKFEDGFIDATDKIKELMASGDFRDPIAERKAYDEANPREESASDDKSKSEKASESSDEKTAEISSNDSSEDELSSESSDTSNSDDSDDEVKFEDL